MDSNNVLPLVFFFFFLATLGFLCSIRGPLHWKANSLFFYFFIFLFYVCMYLFFKLVGG